MLYDNQSTQNDRTMLWLADDLPNTDSNRNPNPDRYPDPNPSPDHNSNPDPDPHSNSPKAVALLTIFLSVKSLLFDRAVPGGAEGCPLNRWFSSA